jgi:2-oxoglutarate ferredoxin oxidoreductase subunit beta
MGSLDHPFNPVSLALGAEASFVARTIDSDRKHLTSVLAAAAAHRGTSLVEIYQNCPIFNDGAFDEIKDRDPSAASVIPLVHGEPIRFGPNKEKGVKLDGQGHATIVDVADVGEEHILVHDEARADPGLAFMLSRLAHGPYEPTPIGVFRAVDRVDYGTAVNQQLAAAQEQNGPGDLDELLHSLPTWTVE